MASKKEFREFMLQEHIKNFTNHKGMNVIGLLWLFVNSSPIALMEQLKNVPSMFHQTLG